MSTAAQQRARRAKDPEKFREYRRRWRAKNIEKARAAGRERMRRKWRENPDWMLAKKRAQYAANPEATKAASRRYYIRKVVPRKASDHEFRAGLARKCLSWQLKTKYGMTIEQKDAMLAMQGGKCAICRRDEPGGLGWYVDHDHASGAVRGVLCARCNWGLGHFLDKPEVVMAAATYLLTHKAGKAVA